MTDTPPTPSSPESSPESSPDSSVPSTDPQAAFRDAFDICIAAIEPFAVMGESRNFLHGDLTPFDGAQTIGQPFLIEPVDEAAQFSGLAKALSDFQAALSAIVFPDRCERNAERARTATAQFLELAGMQSHSAGTDHTDPAIAKQQAKQFYKSVAAWEDATADLANKLGL